MAVAAARAAMAIACLLCMHAGCIGLNWANRANALWCGLPGAVADTAGFTLAAAIERRGTVIRRRHDVNLAMAVIARRQFHARRSLHTEFAMNADGLNLDYLGVTVSAVHRVEPAAVPSVIGPNMAVEAFCRAMNCGLELCEVNFVAIVAGICLLFVVRE